MEHNGRRLRHELKYLINYGEYAYLKPRLEALMKRDIHAGDDGYHIRSLYFDDMYHSALEEKESGIMLRRKYRIRIYNKSDSFISLERKDKFGEFISKISTCLTRDEFYRIINGDIADMASSDVSLKQEMFAEMRTKRLAPSVIVDYQRDVYVYDEGNVRITFDRDLHAGIDTADVFAPNITTVAAMDPGLMVLEVKYDDFLPDVIKNALQIKSHSREAVSKYVYCRQAQFKYNPISKSHFHLFGGNI